MKYLILFLFIACASSPDSQSENVSKKTVNKTSTQKTQTKVRTNVLTYSRSFDQLRDKSAFAMETSEISRKVSPQDEISSMVGMCRSNRINEGLRQAKAIAHRHHKWPSYWNALGLCYMLNKNNYKAKTFFNRAMGVEKNYSPALNNLALLEIKNENWYAAEDLLKKSLKYNPRSQVANYNLGRIYTSYGLGKEAIQKFSKIHDVTFYKTYVSKVMGIAYVQSGDYRKANSIFSKSNNLTRQEKLFFSYSLAKVGDKARAKQLMTNVIVNKNDQAYYLYRDLKRML